eukprot:scaffold5732_cov369-Prasinococcus_capsulatus_cf.AAC.7
MEAPYKRDISVRLLDSATEVLHLVLQPCVLVLQFGGSLVTVAQCATQVQHLILQTIALLLHLRERRRRTFMRCDWAGVGPQSAASHLSLLRLHLCKLSHESPQICLQRTIYA